MSGSNILRGTMLLTGATFLSKLLGMLYVIPFNALVGDTGGALFTYAYNPYMILISISTLGVPLAVSKFISKYNTLGDYETGRRMFKSGMLLMAITGVLTFLALYVSAEWLADRIVATDSTEGNTKEDITMVIKMVSFALIVVPGMSIVRGFFQGYESMGPTALSQVVEQIVRIIFLLVAAFLVVDVFNGSISTAVGYATFAAFIGALASCIVLWYFWKKRKPYLDKQLEKQELHYDLPMGTLYKELLTYAGPFVLIGIATPMYQLVDQFTFHHAMAAIGYTKDISETAYAVIIFYGHKLVIIPVVLATGLSLALLPAITRAFVDNHRKQLVNQVNQSLQIIMLLIFPAVVGMSTLGFEAYGTFYGLDKIDLKGSLLSWYAPVALFYAFFTVTASILQGINEQRFAVVSLGIGLIMKIAFNSTLIHLLGPKGSIIATGIAVLTAVVLNLWRIQNKANLSLKPFLKRSMLIIVFTTIMTITVLVIKWLLQLAFNDQDSRLAFMTILVVCSSVGGLIYLILAYKSTLLERILGERVKKIDRILNRFSRR